MNRHTPKAPTDALSVFRFLVLSRYGCHLPSNVYAVVGAGDNGTVMLRNTHERGKSFAVAPSRIQPRRVEAHVAATAEDRLTLHAQHAAEQARAGAAESQLRAVRAHASASAAEAAEAAGAEQSRAGKDLDAQVRTKTITPDT